MVVGLLGNKSPDLNRFTLVTPKSENDVRLQATLANQNPMGLPVGTVSANLERAENRSNKDRWVEDTEIQKLMGLQNEEENR